MKQHRLLTRLGLLALLTALALAPMMAGASWLNNRREDTVTISREEYEQLKQFALLNEVKQYVDAYFYEEPDAQGMMDGAIQGLLGGLGDAYTFYYNEEAWAKMQEDDSGKYAGIGVMMLGDYEDGTVTIVRVFKDTPAERAGLRKGDVFYKVEDLEVSTATMQDAVDIMRGLPGDEVHIEIVRDGEVLPFDLVKANIVVNRTEHKMIDKDVGYIILFEFAGGSDTAFKESYEALKAQGMKHLILDLRDNPGGWVGSAEKIADIFLDKQLLYYTQDRAQRRQEYVTDEGAETMPLTILVNENSASSSEILAGGLQDHGRANIVGTKTFGKGVIQYVIGLSDEKSGFQLTAAQYYSPTGEEVHMNGIEPDRVFEMPEEFEDTMFETGDLADPQLAATYSFVLELMK